MFKDIFVLRNQDEIHYFDYFTREFLGSFGLGDRVQIECYDEVVYISGELKKNPLNDKLYLIDRNGFICDIEYEKLYEKIGPLND